MPYGMNTVVTAFVQIVLYDQDYKYFREHGTLVVLWPPEKSEQGEFS